MRNRTLPVRAVNPLLKFGRGNGKLDGSVFTFSLPAGWACPFADRCMAKTDPTTGRVSDGRRTEFRCFSASDEVRPSVRQARWHNFDLLRGLKKWDATRLILESLTPLAGFVRIHVSGDFFSQTYFDAWLSVAKARPLSRFYFYTKSVLYWARRLDEVGDGHNPGTVANFVPTASWGGHDDRLIEQHGLRSVRVVLTAREADTLNLKLDHDDSNAMAHGTDFALLIHGVQPKGTPSAKALSALRVQGEYGYGEKADARRAMLSLPTVN